MKAIPRISKYMTTTPHAINAEAPLQEALDTMTKHHVRHLPVIKAGHVFGLISDRDLKSIMSFSGVNPKAMKVGEVCTDEPYMTKPDAALNVVASEMAMQKMGSALVIDNGKLVGIFTATDACNALAELCEARFHS